ncbi:hypothetical protein ACH9EU_04100 [Kocuria sp. M1R5S2]|uniref:hypothetical protein n=1 Tax=Kocuria rhizosphaerae TaxID=3376285 RepID=UPI0037964D4A
MSQSPGEPLTGAFAGRTDADPAKRSGPLREDLGPDEEDLDVDPPGDLEAGPGPDGEDLRG